MFALAYQVGAYLEVFDSKTQVLEVAGTGNRIKFPKSDKPGLGLTQRYLVIQMFVSNPQNWSMELIISDQGKNKRVSFSSAAKDIEKRQYNLIVPIAFPSGKWINVQIDCASFVETSSGSKYKSLESIIMSAPCKIRRIFTCKTLLNKERRETSTSNSEKEDIPKQLFLSHEIEQEYILLTLSQVMEKERERCQIMGDTYQSNFGESVGGSESGSIQGINSKQFETIKKQRDNESDKVSSARSSFVQNDIFGDKDRARGEKVKRNTCEPIQELPSKQQQIRARELSSPAISEIQRQKIQKNNHKYPLPPSSSSSSKSKQLQQQGFYGKSSLIQDDDNKDMQTTAVSDLRGSINTLYTSKQRSALSPEITDSYTHNQLQNVSSNTFNTTGSRANSRLGKQTPINSSKSNNFYKMNPQSRSPKGTTSAATTSTNSATKSNPWSTNVHRNNKPMYPSNVSAFDSSDSMQAGKSNSDLTPERQNSKINKLNSKQVKENVYNLKSKQSPLPPPKIQKPQNKKSVASIEGPPQLKSRQSDKVTSVAKKHTHQSDAEYLEMSSKFSNVGDPHLFQLENIFGGSTDQESKSTLKQPSQQLSKGIQSKELKPKTQKSQQLQQNPRQVKRKEEPLKKKIPIEKTKQQNEEINLNEDEIEEEIESDSRMISPEMLAAYDSEQSQSKSHDLTLQRLSSFPQSGGNMNNLDKFKSSLSNIKDEEIIPNSNKKMINQNSTGLSYSKPNLAISKRKEGTETQFMNTLDKPLNKAQEKGLNKQGNNSNQKNSSKDEYIFTKTEGDQEDLKVSNYHSGYQKQPNSNHQKDDETIGECSEENTLRQTQTKFFKDQISNAMNFNLRPFTPPFNQVPLVEVSVSHKSTMSYQKKIQGQGDEQIEVIYDDVLNCYYDPKTRQYFDLKS